MRIELCVTLLLVGCAGTRITADDANEPTHEVRTIATFGGRTADAVANALNARDDFAPKVMSREETQALVTGLGMNPEQPLGTSDLKKLPAKGIDGWMHVTTHGHAWTDQAHRFIRVRLTSTRDPDRYLAIEWKNAWAGAPGSGADRMVRKSVETAAEEIAEEITAQLNER